MDRKVSCIIPAYNEEKTITGVIKTCLATPEIGEVIVVNDGSKDGTRQKLKKFNKKIKVINLPKNKGKGHAVVAGIKSAQHSFVLLVDADLIKIKPHHLLSLISPVLQTRVDMTIASFPTFQRPNYPLWSFSGQRCFHKELIRPYFKEISRSGYGLEIILNEIFKKKRVVIIPLISYKRLHVIKKYKQSDWLASYIKETWEITQKIIKTKSKTYRQKVRKQTIENLASYFKTNIQKIKNYFEED